MKVGDKIKDNDPRMRSRNRVLTIRVVETRHVFASDSGGRGFNIKLERIHSDGKPRRGGFDLLPS